MSHIFEDWLLEIDTNMAMANMLLFLDVKKMSNNALIYLSNNPVNLYGSKFRVVYPEVLNILLRNAPEFAQINNYENSIVLKGLSQRKLDIQYLLSKNPSLVCFRTPEEGDINIHLGCFSDFYGKQKCFDIYAQANRMTYT
jgi:hypothetical protein